MTQRDKLLGFVTGVLNEDNKHTNAIPYDRAYYDGASEILIAFRRNHRAQYNALLRFCADNSLTVVSTQPASLATAVLCEEDA